jgi:DNA-directed RNA polymerase specialized sigma24 family protein
LVPIEIDEDDDEPKIALRAASANLDAPIDLEELIRDLPEEQAEVIKLRREGHSLEDIAERTGEPLGIIRGRNRLALSKARKKIAPE